MDNDKTSDTVVNMGVNVTNTFIMKEREERIERERQKREHLAEKEQHQKQSK